MDITDQFDLQQSSIANKKKRCHGNRQLQRFKRKCRARGMNEKAIEMLSSIKKENTSGRQCVYNKPMEDPSITKNINNDVHINHPWISPALPTRTHKKMTNHCSLSTDHWKRSSAKLIPKYKKLPNFLFKNLLTKYVLCYHREKIRQWLTNVQVLQFFRQRAEIICDMFQLKIEEDYWACVLDLGTPAMAWLSTIVKNLKQQNEINWDYPRTVENVLHRQKIIQNKLLQAEKDFHAHLQQRLPEECCEEIQNETSINNMMQTISQGLITLIQNDLKEFHTNFEHKKILLKFDVNDVHLVKTFYDLNPTEDQIRSAQKIWRSKVKSCKRIINQTRYSSPTTVEQTTNQFYNDHDYEQRQLLSAIELLDYSMRAIVEARLANIEQRAQQIINFINESLVSPSFALNTDRDLF